MTPNAKQVFVYPWRELVAFGHLNHFFIHRYERINVTHAYSNAAHINWAFFSVCYTLYVCKQ